MLEAGPAECDIPGPSSHGPWRVRLGFERTEVSGALSWLLHLLLVGHLPPPYAVCPAWLLGRSEGRDSGRAVDLSVNPAFVPYWPCDPEQVTFPHLQVVARIELDTTGKA